MARALGFEWRQALAATCDEAQDQVARLHQALEEAKKWVESMEGRLLEETMLREREEGLQQKEAAQWEHVEATDHRSPPGRGGVSRGGRYGSNGYRG